MAVPDQVLNGIGLGAGAFVGAFVGCAVGNAVGNLVDGGVGPAVGDIVGAAAAGVGYAVGDIVGGDSQRNLAGSSLVGGGATQPAALLRRRLSEKSVRWL